MAYLKSPPFEYDVFVSYAHGESGMLKDWTLRLVDRLEGDILDWVPEFRDLHIFIDSKLDPTKKLSDQLRDAVGKSGLLLIVMSEQYINSAWCQSEREWFESEIRQCQSDGGLLFVVRAQPTDHSDWPDVLKDSDGHPVLGFQFHRDVGRGEEPFSVRPYGHPPSKGENEKYYEELSRLSTNLITRLREIRSRSEISETKESSLSLFLDDKPKIYLQPLNDNQDEWEDAKRQLENMGCEVIYVDAGHKSSDLLRMEEVRAEKLKMLKDEAHAACLLRPPGANGINKDLEILVNDRSVMKMMGRNIPCAVIDRSNPEISLPAGLGIDVVSANGQDWPKSVRVWLKSVLDAGERP